VFAELCQTLCILTWPATHKVSCWKLTFRLGRLFAFGIRREGPRDLPLAFVTIRRLSRLAGRHDGIVTKPYDLTLTQVICKTTPFIVGHFV